MSRQANRDIRNKPPPPSDYAIVEDLSQYLPRTAESADAVNRTAITKMHVLGNQHSYTVSTYTAALVFYNPKRHARAEHRRSHAQYSVIETGRGGSANTAPAVNVAFER